MQSNDGLKIKIHCLPACYIIWTKIQIFYARAALTFRTHVFAALFFRNVNRSLCMYKETFIGLIMVPSIFQSFFGFHALLNCNDDIIISYTTDTDLSQKRIRKMASKMKSQERFDFITDY